MPPSVKPLRINLEGPSRIVKNRQKGKEEAEKRGRSETRPHGFLRRIFRGNEVNRAGSDDLSVKRLPAAAGRFGIRIFNGKTGALKAIDIIDLRSGQHRGTVGIDKNLHAVHFDDALLFGRLLFKGHSILEPGTAAAGDIDPQSV